MNWKYLYSGILLMLAMSAIGCGGGPPMNPTQASVALGDVFDALSDSAGSVAFAHSASISRLRAGEAAAVEKAILNGTRVPLPEGSISPAQGASPETALSAYTYKCPSGGSIVVTGSYTETSNSASLTIVETINSCSDSGVTFSGDPNIALSESASDNGTTTSGSLTMTGGLSVGSSSCSINVNESVSVSDKTGNGTVTYNGSFCGQTISGSEPITI